MHDKMLAFAVLESQIRDEMRAFAVLKPRICDTIRAFAVPEPKKHDIELPGGGLSASVLVMSATQKKTQKTSFHFLAF